MTAGLVIGGGGVAGIAWALGVLVGLGEKGTTADAWATIVGTSAGATVGAQLATGRLGEAFDAQFAPSSEIAVDVDIDEYRAGLAALVGDERDGRSARRRIGSMALSASTVTADARRDVIVERLAGATWPSDDRLAITAVDVDTGELVVLRRGDGVPLVDAVAASCAVPGVWPVVATGGRRLMDGGMRSSTNADVSDADVRVVVVPSSLDARQQRRLERELEGSTPIVIGLDGDARDAIGANPFDPSRRSAAAAAGAAQGRRVGPGVARILAG